MRQITPPRKIKRDGDGYAYTIVDERDNEVAVHIYLTYWPNKRKRLKVWWGKHANEGTKGKTDVDQSSKSSN